MEFDIFLPKEGLAIEYQGEQHYRDIYLLGSGWNQKEKDEEKRILCREKEITLIEIPYWWDKQKSSLASTIHKERNDLLTLCHTGSEPIPVQQLSEGKLLPFLFVIYKESSIPIMHGIEWDGDQNLEGW